MNILYLAHRIPYPPNKGDKLRAFRQIERLSRDHRVWCACFVDTPHDWRNVAPLREYCEDIVAVELKPIYAKLRGLFALFGGRTVTEGFYESADMRRALLRLARSVDFDAVVAFSSSMAPYALAIKAPRRVLDLCDFDSRKWLDYAEHSSGLKRAMYRTEGERLADRERQWIDAFDATVLITQSEAELLDTAQPDKLHIIGNGVEIPERFSPVPGLHPTVGFVGVMDYFPNIDAVTWFARECWPMIRSAHPSAVFRIVGRSPTRTVRRLARLDGVQVAGAVDDIADELCRIDVSVAPLRIARGIQNKVLEAMAAAKPVVLTSKAAAGINAGNGADYLVGDTAPQIAGFIRDLLGDAQLRQRVGTSARRFVADRHRWYVELNRFEKIVTGGTQATHHAPHVRPSCAMVLA